MRNRVDVVPISRGYQLDLRSGVVAEVLNPQAESSYGRSGNNEAVVLRLNYGDISFLMTADIEADTEARLASGITDIQSTVLRVAHHGSKTSSAALARGGFDLGGRE